MPVVIPYYGGKFKLSKQLIPMIPKHKHYIEVFAGGLSMFFAKNKAEWNCVNDIDSSLVNLYMVIGDKYLFEIFARKVYYALKSRAYYDQIKDEVKSYKKIIMPDVDAAFKYYYMIRNSFNGRLNTAFSKDISGWTTNLLDNLKFAREALDGVIIENMDFKLLIEKYSGKNNIFWYFDPPYTMAEEQGYYVSSFTNKQHIELKKKVDFLTAMSDAKIMISYDDSEFIKELYKNYNIIKVRTKYAGNRTDPGAEFNELVICNYTPLRQEILNL